MMPTRNREVDVYWPECGSEYRDGYKECSDCHVDLTAEKPPKPRGAGDPDLKLVTVLEESNPLALAAAKDLLEEAGIPFCVLGEELSVRIGPVGASLHPWCRIQVAVDRESEARMLLQQIEPIEEADLDRLAE